MQDMTDRTITSLVRTIVLQAGQFNGNAKDIMLDGGRRADDAIQAAMKEIIRRIDVNPATLEDPVLKPLSEALADVKNITDSREIAKAIKNVPAPEDENAPPKPPSNPFARKP